MGMILYNDGNCSVSRTTSIGWATKSEAPLAILTQHVPPLMAVLNMQLHLQRPLIMYDI